MQHKSKASKNKQKQATARKKQEKANKSKQKQANAIKSKQQRHGPFHAVPFSPRGGHGERMAVLSSAIKKHSLN